MRDGVRPESPELSRGAGKGDRQTASVVREKNRRRGPGKPERDAAFGERCLLADSRQKIFDGTLEALGDPARNRLDLGRELLVERERTPGGGREELNGAVVVGRAQPPDTTQRSAWRPSASAAASSSGRSPTTTTRSGSSPSRVSSCARNGPFRSRRSPRTSSLPVTTTTARGGANYAIETT